MPGHHLGLNNNLKCINNISRWKISAVNPANSNNTITRLKSYILICFPTFDIQNSHRPSRCRSINISRVCGFVWKVWLMTFRILATALRRVNGCFQQNESDVEKPFVFEDKTCNVQWSTLIWTVQHFSSMQSVSLTVLLLLLAKSTSKKNLEFPMVERATVSWDTAVGGCRPLIGTRGQGTHTQWSTNCLSQTNHVQKIRFRQLRLRLCLLILLTVCPHDF